MKEKDFNKLWELLLAKVNKEWTEKYAEFGNINNIKHQTKFCKVLAKDINHVLKVNQQINTTIITWNTLNIYFNQNGFGKKPKKKTLDIIKRYLGDNPEQFLSQEIKNDFSKNNSPLLSKKNRTLILTIILIIISLFCFYIFSKNNETQNLNNEKSKIISLIENANQLEYNLYKSVPLLADTIKINDFYLLDSPNKKQIIKILKKSVLEQKILNSDKSSRLLNKNDIIFDKLTNKEAIVSTIEFWELYWNSIENKKTVAEYKVANKQLYILSKINDKWFIRENQYKGKAKKYNK